MKRRDLLCACAGCSPLLAGCTAGSGPVESDPRHPFANETVSVRIDNRSDTDHDVERNAREALEYWADNAEQFVDFGIEFDTVETDPDMTIAYTDTPEPCRDVGGYSELVLGCAPLITPGRRVPEDLTAYVVAADDRSGRSGSRPNTRSVTSSGHRNARTTGRAFSIWASKAGTTGGTRRPNRRSVPPMTSSPEHANSSIRRSKGSRRSSVIPESRPSLSVIYDRTSNGSGTGRQPPNGSRR